MEKAHHSTPGEDRHMCPLTFLYEIQFQTTFIWIFFDVMRIFGIVEPQSESNFPFLYIIIFQIYWSLESLAPLVGEIDICAREVFCTKFNSEELLLEAFFMWCVFLVVMSPKVNPLLYIIRVFRRLKTNIMKCYRNFPLTW